MDILIALVVVAAAALLFVRRRSALKRIAKTYGDDVHPKTVSALLKTGPGEYLEKDGLWIQEHERELAARFRGQWIAVVQGEVVAIGSTADEAWRVAASVRPGLAAFVRRIA